MKIIYKNVWLGMIGMVVIHSSGCNIPPMRNVVLPDSLYSFFPKNTRGMELEYACTNAKEINKPSHDFDAFFLMEGYKMNTAKATIMKERFSQEAVVKARSNDSICVIGSQYSLEKKYGKERLKRYYYKCKKDIITVSMEECLGNVKNDLYNYRTMMGLPEDYQVYVLKKGKQNILPQSYIRSWEILPKEIEHGYSSGVAFNETDPFIIYWAVAW